MVDLWKAAEEDDFGEELDVLLDQFEVGPVHAIELERSS